jgi:hypothetical protein
MRLGIVLVAFGLGSCGGGSVPLDQCGAQLEATRCHKLLACCSLGQIAALDRTIVDEATCEASFAASGNSVVAAAAPLVDAGVVIYRGDQARACLDALAGLDCETWSGGSDLVAPPSPCNRAFEGTLAAGSPCTVSMELECASGACTNDATGALACAAPVGLGQSCEAAPCVLGLRCVSDPTSGGPRTCGQPLPDGAVCALDQDCASGSCVFAAISGPNTCARPPMCHL